MKKAMTMIACILAVFLLTGISLSAQLPSPESYFGFKPGTDKMLINYDQLVGYLQTLEKGSKMIRMQEVGKSTLGKPMYVVCISSEKNITNLSRLVEINRQLALNPALSPQELTRLTDEGKVFVLVTLSMHSTEVGPSQAAPDIAYELLTNKQADLSKILDDVVFMMVPNHNPDGMDMVVSYYNKTKNTSLDGSSMPGVYHKYVGHNINRDFVWLTQAENKVVAHLYNLDWFPQVMIEKHQMGSTGPRYYVSPPHDPIAENVEAGIWNWQRVFGSQALTDMTAAGLKGVSLNYLFDDYWPGSTTTSIWKGVIGMLSEMASVNLASPIYIEPIELRTTGKGLGQYAKSINMPEPWPGGWWRLGDMIEYERVNTLSYLRTASMYRKDILEYRNSFTRNEIEKGHTTPPFYYLMPLIQRDQGEMVALVNLLAEHNIQTFQLTEDVLIENRLWKKGDLIIPTAQPFRSFIKEVMEKQTFPVRYYTAGGEMIRPYDVTSWSLPLHKGVEATEVNSKPVALDTKYVAVDLPFSLTSALPARAGTLLFSVNNNESFKAVFAAFAAGLPVERTTGEFVYQGVTFPAGSFLVKGVKNPAEFSSKLTVSPMLLGDGTALPPATPLKLPRIAMIESWFSAMDAGWARFVFDQYGIPYTVLRPADMQTADLTKFDVIVISDESKSVLMNGKMGQEGAYSIPRIPPENAKGMEKKGFDNLIRFITAGGRVLSWGGSAELFIGAISIGDDKAKEEFQLPVRNIAADLAKNGLDVPGSLLKVQLAQNHPLTYGLPAEIGIFHRGTPVFMTSIPYLDMDRRVIATFPETDILLSGFADKNVLLAKRAAMVWLRKGKGQIVMYGFSPHARGQMQGTYKLLFNGLLLPAL